MSVTASIIAVMVTSSFAQIVAAFVEEEVFGKLLADGRSARLHFAAVPVAPDGVLNAAPIEAAVSGKTDIFGSNQGFFRLVEMRL